MTAPILTAPRLSGKRLVATLGVAAAAAIATGVISAQALQTVAPDWSADPQRLAAVIVALVYLCITVVVFPLDCGYAEPVGAVKARLILVDVVDAAGSQRAGDRDREVADA